MITDLASIQVQAMAIQAPRPMVQLPMAPPAVQAVQAATAAQPARQATVALAVWRVQEVLAVPQARVALPVSTALLQAQRAMAVRASVPMRAR